MMFIKKSKLINSIDMSRYFINTFCFILFFSTMYSQEKMNLSSHLKQPKSLVINSVGEMYICNTLSHSIEKYNPYNESVSTIAENLNFPQNIALDQSGNIFITDSFSKQKGDKILLQDTTPHLIDCSDWEYPEESIIVFTYNSNKVVFTLIG